MGDIGMFDNSYFNNSNGVSLTRFLVSPTLIYSNIILFKLNPSPNYVQLMLCSTLFLGLISQTNN
jgi:hypothetical protein